MKAALNTVGGQEYYYAVRGDGQRPVAPIPGGRQREALETVLRTLETDFLALPERIVELIPPPAYRKRGEKDSTGTPGSSSTRWPRRTPRPTTPWSFCSTGADGAARQQPRLGSGAPGLAEVLDRLGGEDLGNAEPDDNYRRRCRTPPSAASSTA